jgi:hypothetical protein
MQSEDFVLTTKVAHLQVVVNVYYHEKLPAEPGDRKTRYKVTLAGRHIPFEGMLQVSNRFAREASALSGHPEEPSTICWNLPEQKSLSPA